MKTLKRQYLATAKHHDKAARAYTAFGKTEDAESARKAAAGCRRRAAEIK